MHTAQMDKFLNDLSGLTKQGWSLIKGKYIRNHSNDCPLHAVFRKQHPWINHPNYALLRNHWLWQGAILGLNIRETFSIIQSADDRNGEYFNLDLRQKMIQYLISPKRTTHD